MKRDVAAMASQEFDLIVIGGGIFGICAAWDATLRGLSVALIERDDWGHATSANHFKVVHGGIRYLQHVDIPRIRESSAERRAFLRVAPHLVQPMPFVIPTYGYGLGSRPVMQAGLALYDLVTADRNSGIRDKRRRIPRGRTISRRETLRLFPHVNPTGLTGAAIFHDGQMYNPARLSLAFVQSAAEAGAAVANYAEAVAFLRDDEQPSVSGVVVHDRLTGDEVKVRSKSVLNAAGPWARWLLDASPDLTLKRKPTFSRDAYFVVNKPLVHEYALAIQGQTKDPDAVVSRGNRHLFLVPWRGYTLIGVWHVVFDGYPDDMTIAADDVQGFINEVNASHPTLDLTLDDVCMVNAGLTLFGENDPEAADLSYGKRSILIDHQTEHGINGLVSLIGVRYTTARGMAEKAIDLIERKLGRQKSPCNTAHTPVYGGDFKNFASVIDAATKSRPMDVATDAIPALVHNYGALYTDLFGLIEKRPELAKTIGSTTVLQAEIVHAAHEEMACKLSDVVLRRTDLGAGAFPGEAALHTCADLLAAELGWGEEEKERELADVRAAYPDFLRKINK